MSKLIIIRGNSGSGKSTLASNLHKEYLNDSLLIQQDVIRRDMLNGDDNSAIKLLIDLLQFGKNNYDITILEGIFVLKKYRTLFEAIKEIYNQENIQAYYYDLSFEETLRRHQTRDVKNEFGEEKMASWFVDKDYLNDFNEMVFTESISLEKSLEIINYFIKQR